MKKINSASLDFWSTILFAVIFAVYVFVIFLTGEVRNFIDYRLVVLALLIFSQFILARVKRKILIGGAFSYEQHAKINRENSKSSIRGAPTQRKLAITF